MDTIIPLVFIVVLVWFDWRYRAKRDGAWHATKAYIFAGLVFLFANACFQKFGMQGLLLAPILIVGAIIVLLLRQRTPPAEVIVPDSNK